MGRGTRTNPMPAASPAAATWIMFSASSRKSSSPSTSSADSGRISLALLSRADLLNRVTAAADHRHHPEVGAEAAAQPRALHLDHDLRAVEQERVVHLRDARRRPRLGVEEGEDLRQRPAQAGLHRRARPGPAGIGGTSSRHQAKAATHSSGSMPCAVAMPCPTFT